MLAHTHYQEVRHMYLLHFHFIFVWGLLACIWYLMYLYVYGILDYDITTYFFGITLTYHIL